jgi:hypothetical protein
VKEEVATNHIRMIQAQTTTLTLIAIPPLIMMMTVRMESLERAAITIHTTAEDTEGTIMTMTAKMGGTTGTDTTELESGESTMMIAKINITMISAILRRTAVTSRKTAAMTRKIAAMTRRIVAISRRIATLRRIVMTASATEILNTKTSDS